MYHREIVKKVMVGALLFIIAALLIFWMAGSIVQSRSISQPWPRKLGTIKEVPLRYPPTADSAAATELVRLANAAGANLAPGAREQKPPDKIRGAIADYIRLVIEERGDKIAPPPPAVQQYLDEHRAQFDAIRDHLLSGEPIVWRSNLGGDPEPIPNLLGQLHLARVFTARALVSDSNAAAWNELHAVWQIARSLWKRPEIISVLIALASSRMANAAARKMPEPHEPQWFTQELRPFDVTGATIAAEQAEAWRVSQLRSELPRFARPFARFYAARTIGQMREYVERVDGSGACDIKTIGKPKGNDIENLASVFGRVLRYRAEVEATERVLQLRRGEMPLQKSQCKDGWWIVSPERVRFSLEIRVEPPGHRIPLAYEHDRDVVLLPPPTATTTASDARE